MRNVKSNVYRIKVNSCVQPTVNVRLRIMFERETNRTKLAEFCFVPRTKFVLLLTRVAKPRNYAKRTKLHGNGTRLGSKTY